MFEILRQAVSLFRLPGVQKTDTPQQTHTHTHTHTHTERERDTDRERVTHTHTHTHTHSHTHRVLESLGSHLRDRYCRTGSKRDLRNSLTERTKPCVESSTDVSGPVC